MEYSCDEHGNLTITVPRHEIKPFMQWINDEWSLMEDGVFNKKMYQFQDEFGHSYPHE